MHLSGGHDTKAKSPIKQERPASPVPSCVSMKSDRSIRLPIEFREGDFSTERRYKDKVALLLNKSEFHSRSQTSGNWISSTTSPIKQERPASPVPSCVSMKSDRSMSQPLNLREGDFSTEQRYTDKVALLLNKSEFHSRRQTSGNWISSTTRYHFRWIMYRY